MSEGPLPSQVATGRGIVQASDHSTAILNYYEYAPTRPVDTKTLEAAQRRLAELPLDKVPAVAELPHGSRMPFSPNPLFVGREDKLLALAQSLGANAARGRPATVAVTGIGGVGKSQLASEFVHHYGQYFLGGSSGLASLSPAP